MYKLLKDFPEIMPYRSDIEKRISDYRQKLSELTDGKNNISFFANGYEYYGFHKRRTDWIYREWAPGADALYLTGDFNNWNWTSHPMTPLENGDWEITLPKKVLFNGSRVLTIVKNGDKLTQHIPAYIRRAVQDENTHSWCGEVIDDKSAFTWEDKDFINTEKPIIYEAHIGMATEEYRYGTYIEFADNVLPHIKEGGYNTIQLMGIMEHPYYGSAGYQVSNFFAPSSRYGCPDDLKYLINKAHKMGLRIILDVIHSHSVGNSLEGLNLFDGTDYQYFHTGGKGNHPAWGTKCFNYGKNQVLHFLLSNLKYWMKVFHFDGFRFDGVTSMLYLDHALGTDFCNLKQYFSMNTDTEAVTYLMLANALIKRTNRNSLTIAEDMSGMPGLCSPIKDGGIGFDYRLAMGLPDMWIKLIKDYPADSWNMDFIWHELTFRNTPTIAYAESHDQALVGDKTIIFRLADAEMYSSMENSRHNPTIDRATACHKLIRLITISAGGSGYLNFMGNEFGHPEWIDFPSIPNGNSFHYCRRQWSLLENPLLKYKKLNAFDADMVDIIRRYNVLNEEYPNLKALNNKDNIIAFERGGLLFAFNFHPYNSVENYVIPVSKDCDYNVLFTSDDEKYGGFSRIAHQSHSAFLPGYTGNYIRLYMPPLTCIVLEPKKL